MTKSFMCILCVMALFFGEHYYLFDNNSSVQSEVKIITEEDDIMPNNCRLIVNGTDISADNYVYLHDKTSNYRVAELPLTAVMQALGATVEWENQNSSIITFNNDVYILDTTKSSLVRQGTEENMIAAAYGLPHDPYYKLIDDEFIVDSDTIQWLIQNMGATIKIDYDTHIIYIEKEATNSCQLIVNGTDISADNYVYLHYDDKYADLPFIAIMKALGATVEWKSENTVQISYKENIYFLNIQEPSLVEQSNSINLIAPSMAFMNHCYYRFVDNEALINSNIIYYFFNEIDISMSIDFDSSVINIENKTANNCNLFVNGIDISNHEYVYLHYADNAGYSFAELPLISIMEALGATVKWESETTAKILYDNKVYILDTSVFTLIEEKSKNDLFMLPPGTVSYYRFRCVDDELLLPDSAAYYILKEMGVQISIDYNNSAIYVDYVD